MLGALSDGVVLVTRHGVTKQEQLRPSVQMLRSVDAHLLGVVLNMVPPKWATAYGYGYGYGYGYVADKPVRKKGQRSEGSSHVSADTAPVPAVRSNEQSEPTRSFRPAHRDG